MPLEENAIALEEDRTESASEEISGCVEDVSSQAMKRAKKMETVMNVKILAISKNYSCSFSKITRARSCVLRGMR